jgi:2-octaprenyl-6-methoxyphenol hydroxylase
LKAVSAPLRHLEILDETGGMVTSPPLLFSSEELHRESFGWNIPLAELVPALRQRASQLGVVCVEGKAKSAEVVVSGIEVLLEDGQVLRGEVTIAADGADSVLRNSAGILIDLWAFDQNAMVTSFDHSGPHHDTSTERHRLGGPFTTVPLPGNRSSLVWMGFPTTIESLMELPIERLAMEVQMATHGKLGLISNLSLPRSFAMRGIKAREFAARRTLLVGEAAHAFPPIGAQGLNMSLRDAGHAVDVIVGRDDAGSDEVMAQYNAARQADVLQRQLVITALNRSLLAAFLPIDILKAGAMAAISTFPPLRELVMREGLAPTGHLPVAMRE